jgi:hypothetical protein
LIQERGDAVQRCVAEGVASEEEYSIEHYAWPWEREVRMGILWEEKKGPTGSKGRQRKKVRPWIQNKIPKYGPLGSSRGGVKAWSKERGEGRTSSSLGSKGS